MFPTRLSIVYKHILSDYSVAYSHCYTRLCLSEWIVVVFVVIYFSIQGEKGDRGPVIRPKVRRFVVMKGDSGPPGVKGKKCIMKIDFV
jgi:hypothetical protein